jgi:hypothetical protein
MDAEKPETPPNILGNLTFHGPDLDAGDIITDAVVVVRVQNPERKGSRVRVFRSAGIDVLAETAMLQISAKRDMAEWVPPVFVVADDDND